MKSQALPGWQEGEALPHGYEAPNIEDMTRDELIETIRAMEEHHNDHHKREDAAIKRLEDEMKCIESTIKKATHTGYSEETLQNDNMAKMWHAQINRLKTTTLILKAGS